MVRIKKTNPIQPKKPKKTVVKERSDKPYCCICMDEIQPKKLASLDVCNHQYCKGCIETWAKTENSCPQCKRKFKKITHIIPENMIITKGREGTEYQGKLYRSEKVKVFDVVGAGDTFLAALTYGYLKYGRIEEAIPFANKAAAIAVSHTGTYVLKEEDVKKILH